MQQKFTSYIEKYHSLCTNGKKIAVWICAPRKIIVTFEIARKYLYIGCYSLRVWVAIKTCQLTHIRQLKSRQRLFDVTKSDLN